MQSLMLLESREERWDSSRPGSGINLKGRGKENFSVLTALGRAALNIPEPQDLQGAAYQGTCYRLIIGR